MSELKHYGIPGQKKGVRRWQNADGSFNEEGKIRYGRIGKGIKNYKKKLSGMSDKEFAKSYRRHQIATAVNAGLTLGGNAYLMSRSASHKAVTAFNIGSMAISAGLGVIGKMKISEMSKRIGVKDWSSLRSSASYGLKESGDATNKMYKYLRENK